MLTKLLPKEVVEKISDRLNDPQWLRMKRLDAFNFFSENNLPNLKYGLSIFTDLSEFQKVDIHPNMKLFTYQIKEKIKYNGKTDDKNKLIIEPFFDAIKFREELIKKYFLSSVKMNPFIALNIATFTNGLFIYIPANYEAEQPIILNSTVNTAYQADYILIVAEKNSKVSIIQNNKSDVTNELGFKSNFIEIFLGENANMQFADIQNLQQNMINFSFKNGVIGKDATLNWIDCAIGSKLTVSSVNSVLQGEHSSTNDFGLFFGTAQQQFDIEVNALHNSKNSHSNLITKGVLDGKSKAIYHGLIKIKENAIGSNGYQKDDTLLLSEEAEADAIPNLEIENNEVKCSHGASIGQIDSEKLFYIMSRGIPKEMAIKKSVEGFFEPLYEKIGVGKIQDELRKEIDRKISKSKND